MRYRWPGNVRELQNFIERAVILSPHTVLRSSLFANLCAQQESIVTITVLEEVERDHIVRALDASNWVVGGRSGAAERLGLKWDLLGLQNAEARNPPSRSASKEFRRPFVPGVIDGFRAALPGAGRPFQGSASYWLLFSERMAF